MGQQSPREETDPCELNWHFSATSHGKGTVDSIGGTIKQSVFRSIKAHTYYINNAKQYPECAQQVVKNIIIIHIDSAAITAIEPDLDDMWESVIGVTGPHGVHCIGTLEDGRITVARYSE